MNLVITSAAERDVTGLSVQARRRIRESLRRFLEAPGQADIKKLHGSPDQWRLRAGDYRIIMRFGPEPETVYVLRVRHRREAYR